MPDRTNWKPTCSTASTKPGEFKLIEQVRQMDGIYYCKVPMELEAPCGWYGLDPLPIEFMKADALAPG